MDDFKRKPVNRLDPQGDPEQPPSPPESVSVFHTPSATNAETTSIIEPQPLQRPTQQPAGLPTPQPVETPPEEPAVVSKKPRSRKRLIVWSLLGLLVAGIICFASVWFWFQSQLAPADSNDQTKVLIQIREGSATSIANTLKEKGIIRSETAFIWYTRFNGSELELKPGAYSLSASESTPEIVTHLTSGKVDTFEITFLPGATLEQNRKVFIEAGYTNEQVTEAFQATYDSPLFQDKPATADLEGYIYGDTFKFSADASVKDVLEYVFDHYASIIEENNLVAGYASQGLTLYQGITLASIIQRESIGGDEAQIAQVFFSRLAIDMQLGSDVTYQYIADKLGVERDTNLDSPYNTRRYTGLPPGPIATPGLASLKAVANPAPGDYLYFLSGDDDITYYGRTLQEHEANIVNHCKQKCQII